MQSKERAQALFRELVYDGVNVVMKAHPPKHTYYLYCYADLHFSLVLLYDNDSGECAATFVCATTNSDPTLPTYRTPFMLGEHLNNAVPL